jgi:hypothetical protein
MKISNHVSSQKNMDEGFHSSECKCVIFKKKSSIFQSTIFLWGIFYKILFYNVIILKKFNEVTNRLVSIFIVIFKCLNSSC